MTLRQTRYGSKRFEEIVGSQMKYLGERLDAIFKAAQKGSHDIITSGQEADRYVIYTYLIVGDLLSLVELQKHYQFQIKILDSRLAY